MHFFDKMRKREPAAGGGGERQVAEKQAGETETETAATCSRFWGSWAGSAAFLLLPAVVGLVPFLAPLGGELRSCEIPSSAEAEAAAAAADISTGALAGLTIPCAAIDTGYFIYNTCPLWLLICAAMLLEFYDVQLRSLGFGEPWHVAFIVVGAEATFIGAELLFAQIFTPVGIVAVLALHMSALICGMWPFLTLAIWLVRAHGRESERQQHAHDHDQEDGDAAGPETEEQPALRRGDSLYISGRDLGTTSMDEEEEEESTPVPVTVSAAVEPSLRHSMSLGMDAKAQVLAHRWRANAHYGETARAATVRGFVLWSFGIALLVVNWVWLQAFVLIYMKEANTPSRISVGVLVFNVSEALFAKAVQHAMKAAELQRVGTRHASFDRFHLTNLSTFAFLCYSAIFRQSLFVNITDWESFASFYLTNALSYFIGFVIPMSEKAHNVSSVLKTQDCNSCCK